MGNVQLQNQRLQVIVDGETGALRAIEHRAAGLSLIADPDRAAGHPFMVILVDGTILRTWNACTVEEGMEGTIQIQWTLDHSLRLQADLALDRASGELRYIVALSNPDALPVAALAYPYIAGIGRLGESPAADELVHPYATGFLVRDPLSTLPPISSEIEGSEPIVLGLYPEGFSGSTMQFMAYSAAGRGGFYVATEDGEGRETTRNLNDLAIGANIRNPNDLAIGANIRNPNDLAIGAKWLNFYRHPDGDLRLAIWHGPADYATRREIAPGYATVLAALDGGTWYDAADRYKAWALGQPWTAGGPLWAREDRTRWLLERVGLCTFGINPRHDRTPWLAEIDRIAGTPVMHLLGPSWPRTEADYHNHLPGGLKDWFPAHFDPANLALIRANGDYLVPFEFDLLFGRGDDKADAAAGEQALQVFPPLKLSRDAYQFPFLCPASPFTRALHAERDRTLAAEWGVDGVYYDISVNNVRHICLSDAHGRAPGDAATITAAYASLLAETATAMREGAGGRALPQGTEMINEQMIPYISFYQARAEASPAAPFEAGPFLDLIKRGSAEKIPLFAYVYHEYGPQRLDGWAKLSREQGDFVYFVLGRVFLQGGLIELNYEFSGLESLGEQHDVPDEHYWRFDVRQYSIDPDLAQFVGRLARARVGRANRYLAYGTMRRPAPLVVVGSQTLELAYFLYNSGQDWHGYEERGVMTVPTVLQTAWQFREESSGWMLLNLATEERGVELILEPPSIAAVSPPGWRVALHRESEASMDLGALTGPRQVTVTLPSRRPVLIEATPLGGDIHTS